MALTFKYGNYEFVPRPLLSINSEMLKTPDGSGFGIEYTLNLQGSILLVGDQVASGVTGVFSEINRLKDALSQDGRDFVIDCGGGNYLISGQPLITSLNIERASDNYTRRADYTIELKMPTLTGGGSWDNFNNSAFLGVETCEESWDVEFQDERLPFEWTLEDGTKEKFGYKVAMTHTVNVKGRPIYVGNQMVEPWKSAKTYAEQRLGFDAEFFTLTGILGLPGTNFFSTYDVFNQFRRVSINKSNGDVNVTETFVVTPSGQDSLPNNAIETFNIDISQNDGIHNVTVQGEIQGLASITYTGGPTQQSFAVNSSKYSAASGYFKKIQGRLYERAKTAFNAYSGAIDVPLSPGVSSKSIGINPIDGTISYNYTYVTQPGGWITGEYILSKNITISDDLANDLFASHTVIGKAGGPILQDLNTISARTRSINIELVTWPPKKSSTVAEIYEPIPTGDVEAFISLITGDIGSTYGSVYTSRNTQDWNFTVGRYSRNVSITYTDCNA